MAKNQFSGGMEALRPPVKSAEPEEIPNAMATRKRRGKRGMTVYVDPVAHEEIKALAKERGNNTTIEDLWLEGMNHVLTAAGRKAIA